MSAVVRNLPRADLCAAFSAALVAGWLVAAPARAQSDDVSHMTPKQLVEERCAACHGTDGNGSEADAKFPKLAGQTVAYLATQLTAFRTGARTSDLMSPQAHDLSDEQIVGLARYFSRQPVKPDAVTDQAIDDHGEQVYFTPRRGIPPCAACHSGGGLGPKGMMNGHGMMGGMMGGMGMMGNMGPVPNLGGQHAAYILAQLDAFAKGTRKATVMRAVASTLSEKNRKAVAEYLSGLR